MPASYMLVYMTARDSKQAGRIASALVRERLAACVNVLGPISSLYRWEGRVGQDREVAFLAKTTRARWPALLKRVKELHSYKVPCVVALPVAAGNPVFLKWLASEVRPIPGGVRPAARSAAGSKRAAARR